MTDSGGEVVQARRDRTARLASRSPRRINSAGTLPVADQGRVFLLAFAVRLVAVAILVAFAGSLENLSRDSYWYHVKGIHKAEAYRLGEIEWSKWIDSGWYEFVGVVYCFVAPSLFVVLVINAALAAAGAVLVFRITFAAFEDLAVAKLTALVYAVFPSVVYYTSMPLKEAAALFAILGIVWGVVSIISEKRHHGWMWITVGLLIIASLRVYLVPILIGCAALSLVPMRLQGGTGSIIQVCVAGALLVVVAYSGVQYYNVDLSEHEATQYYDLERVNEVRVSLSRGNTALFDRRRDAAFSESVFDNAVKVAKGFFYFLFTVDVTNITRARQMAALPEMLFFLYCLSYLYHGSITAWKRRPNLVLPILVFGAAIILVYGSATTNAGTMYRWRLQALPFLLMLIVYGASVRRRGALFRILRPFYGTTRQHRQSQFASS